MSSTSKRGNLYKLVYENALNRRNVSEEVFLEEVEYDTVKENYMGRTVYLQGERPVAYYSPEETAGYIAVEGLANNPPK